MAKFGEYTSYDELLADLNNDLLLVKQTGTTPATTKKISFQKFKDVLGVLAGGVAGGDLTGTYPNPTIAPNKVTNSKLEQMPANTIKGNGTGATANPQDIALQPMISGESSLVAGTRTITDSRVTANSVVLVTMSTTGVSTSVPIKYTKNAGVSVVFSTGQPSDTCNFSYLIIF